MHATPITVPSFLGSYTRLTEEQLTLISRVTLQLLGATAFFSSAYAVHAFSASKKNLLAGAFIWGVCTEASRRFRLIFPPKSSCKDTEPLSLSKSMDLYQRLEEKLPDLFSKSPEEIKIIHLMNEIDEETAESLVNVFPFLTEATSFWLLSCQIEGGWLKEILQALKSCKKLTSIHIHDVDLKCIDIDALSPLTQITHLKISGAKLNQKRAATLRQVLGTLRGLKEINLTENDLSDGDQRLFTETVTRINHSRTSDKKIKLIL